MEGRITNEKSVCFIYVESNETNWFNFKRNIKLKWYKYKEFIRNKKRKKEK